MEVGDAYVKMHACTTLDKGGKYHNLGFSYINWCHPLGIPGLDQASSHGPGQYLIMLSTYLAQKSW